MAEHLADEEISIGDYVLSGGELAAAVVIDAVARLLPGVLGNEAFGGERIVQRHGRPRQFWIARSTRGRRSSAAGRCRRCCSSGHHEEIRRWRREAALEKTRRLRPDLLAQGLPEQELVGQESGKHNE